MPTALPTPRASLFARTAWFDRRTPAAPSAAPKQTAVARAPGRHAYQDIIDGLLREVPGISPKYFYDQKGSELFTQITEVPEYYPTRTEHALMVRHGPDIARAIGKGGVVIELGAGSCEKARGLCRLLQPFYFIGIDISADYLQDGVARLRADLPGLDARAVGGDITRGVQLPADLPQTQRLVFYPGSSIGNFDPPQAIELLTHMRELAGADGGLLIGIDLPKDTAVLEAAYDDAAGVTAAFNRNILSHVNRLIQADFDPQQWQHRAFFNTAASRIEMHLEARSPQRVRWAGGGRDFAAGERIHTENSYKYTVPVFSKMLAQAGFSQPQAWTDERGWYAMVHART